MEIAAPALVATLVLMSVNSANAAEGVDAQALMAAQADADGYIIVQPEDGVPTEDGAVFYPTGPISEDTLVVIAQPDGSLPGGVSEAQLKRQVAQRQVSSDDDDRIVTPFATHAYYGYSSAVWSQTYNGSGVIGTDASARAYYTFTAHAGTGQQNAGQGRGYFRGYNGSEFGTLARWYGLGYATGDSPGAGSTPWGNVSAIAQFRVMCGTSTVCGGYFTP